MGVESTLKRPLYTARVKERPNLTIKAQVVTKSSNKQVVKSQDAIFGVQSVWVDGTKNKTEIFKEHPYMLLKIE